MFRVIVIQAAIAIILSACAYRPSSFQLTSCGGNDKRNWKITKHLPDNAEKMRQMADRNAFDPPEKETFETWFTLSTGEVMLCRTPRHPYYGEWWQFEQTDE